MWYEQIAQLTRDHIKVHLPAYLEDLNQYYDHAMKLELPKHFDIATIVGGSVGMTRSTLPAFAIAAEEKAFSTSDDDLWQFIYTGQITGMVGAAGAGGAKVVETMARRYAGGLEKFISDHHRRPFANDFDETTYPFRITGLGYSRTEFFGAANVEEAGQRFWVDGFRIELAWEVAESGPGQHG